VIVLDENIPDSQRQLLRSWRIRVVQVGREIARPGVLDEAIIPLLRRLHKATFFTRDIRFYDPVYRHRAYGLVTLAVSEAEAASFIRRVWRHRALDTHRKRVGKVVRATHAGLRLWRLHSNVEERLGWPRLSRVR
jgi:hypothetical protein